MSQLSELISELCPGDVEFKTLGEAGTFYGGLTGKTRKDFGVGDAKYIPYKNIFDNEATDLAATESVSVGAGERQNRVRRGDVLFTGSSESLAEVGMSSVVADEPEEPLYLNSFSIGFRWHENELLLPGFAAHLFRSEGMRRQIIGTANGVTRFNVSKVALKKVTIPVPPHAVQRAIVNVLTTMKRLRAELEADLRAELRARSLQSAHYREALLSFPGRGNVPWVPMGEIGRFFRGKRFTKADYVEHGGVPAIHYGEIYTRYGTSATAAHSYVRPELSESLRFARTGDVVLAGVGETVEDVGKAVAWLGDEDVAIHDDCFAYRHEMDPKFVAHFFQTKRFHDELAKHVARAKVKRISGKALATVTIPVVPIEEQRHLVSVLDELDALVNRLSATLPLEIAARRTQYEYYRDLFMTFSGRTA